MLGLELRARRANRWWTAPRKVEPKNNLRSDIQGLRAFAVIVVIFDHLMHWPKGGFIGVDVFFVISGFVITESLLREHERTGRVSFTGFYRRRIKRILPASTAVLLVTVVASFLTLNQVQSRSVAWDALWALLFSGNWHFAAIGTDYFQSSGPVSPLQHYWSLAVEEQFYFVWPWIMVLVFAAVKNPSHKKFAGRLFAGAAITTICAASFIWALHETTASPTMAYFSTFSRAWELGVGASIAVAAPVFAKLPTWLRPSLAWIGVAGMVTALAIIDGDHLFPAPAAVLPVLSSALFIIAGTGETGQRALFPFTNAVSGYLGNISYSLYLWHFPIIVIVAAYMDDSPLYWAVASLLIVVSAVYSYHLLEDPVRKSAWLTDARRRQPAPLSQSYKITALSLLAVITFSVVAATWTPPSSKLAAATPVSVPTIPAGERTEELQQQSTLRDEIVISLSATEWPALKPSLEEVIGGPQAPEEIGICGRTVVDEEQCTWGDPHAKRTIITVGNSTSMAYVAALRSAIGTADGWKIVSYGMFGCPFGSNESLSTLKIMPTGCQERASQAIEAINRIRPEVVIASGVYDSAAEILDQVTVPVKTVFLPGPPVDKNVSKCYTQVSAPADCVGTVPGDWGATERKLALSVPNAVYVDSIPWFCYQGKCPSFVGTVPVKLDASHITATYAERLGPVIQETFRKQGIFSQ